MIILLLGALALAGASAALVLRAVALPRMRAGETVSQIESYGYSSRQGDNAASDRSGGSWTESRTPSAASCRTGSAACARPSFATS